MRASTVVTFFCVAASIAPSFATSSESQQHSKRVLNWKQVATYGLVAATINAVLSTEIVTDYAYLVRATNKNATKTSRREVLELFDARINQELASREYRRALTPLYELD